MAEVDNKLNVDNIASKRKRLCRENDKTLSSSEYVLRKTKFSKFNRKGSKDIFVNNKSHFKAQLYKCEKLFDNGASELIIHGLGAAVYKATSLALRLNEIHHGCLDLDIKTSTVQLEDKLESLNDDMDDEINNRQNSAIHIRVFRKIPVAVLRSTN
ncbi:ribonuclease P protein subunit p20 [Harpegnathos saltator]|uniref:Ribonuclease P protein subunit p20 n=1 Tax=Harpegnathos saltator TaxID=610380 RepID=E2C3V4_HARSA|nr:ribonuclease P protein subunit p20 [Harpegnathos saltator]EFN77340.1 Ribonuclease P protein subunit p20 [Harpegnathos saltator]